MFIEVTAELSPGMSGGPAVDIRGQLVGINVAAIDDRRGYRGQYLIPAAEIFRVFRENDLHAFSELLRLELIESNANAPIRESSDQRMRERADAFQRALEEEIEREKREAEALNAIDFAQRRLNQYFVALNEISDLGLELAVYTDQLMSIDVEPSMSRSRKAREIRDAYKKHGYWDRVGKLWQNTQSLMIEIRQLGVFRSDYLDVCTQVAIRAKEMCEYAIAPTSSYRTSEMNRAINEYRSAVDAMKAYVP